MKMFRRFTRDEDGSVTIEAVLWFPVFMLFLVMLADAAIIFMNKARITRIVQDGTRAYAVGRIDTCAELEDWLEDRIEPIAPSVQATCDPTAITGIAVAWVTIPTRELDLSGATGLLGNLTLRIQTQQFMES